MTDTARPADTTKVMTTGTTMATSIVKRYTTEQLPAGAEITVIQMYEVRECAKNPSVLDG